jgi:predicted ATPase
VIAGNVGNDVRMSYGIFGDTVNTASRLEAIAVRGQILVTQNTYRLTRSIFEFRPLEPIRVQGKKDSLAVFELLEPKIRRDTMYGLEGLISPLVGRDWEFKVLKKAINATRVGQGALILLSGEAGVGKTRLLEEVRACESTLRWLDARCIASAQSLSYSPILDLLRKLIGTVDKQSTADEQTALRRYVSANFSVDPQAYSVLSQLLALPLTAAETELLGELKGEKFRALFFGIVERALLLVTEQEPTVVIIDDLHWADTSSVELLVSLLPLIKGTRLSFVLVSRSRERPITLWNGLAPALEKCRDHLVEVPLQPLSINQSRTLMDELLKGEHLPEPLTVEILDKSEGNPFFLEEVLRSLIESGGLTMDNGKWTLSAPVGILRVPDTVQGVLLSRLDRLSEELKQLTQKAAVIGRVFHYRTLERIVRADNSLREQLASLEISGLVRERRQLPELEFSFRHALTQEVAYQTLLGPTRKALHRKVGEALESIFGDRVEEFTGVLAYHFFSAESWHQALDYLSQAGDTAFRVCAYAEARVHYGRALECLKHLEEDASHLHQKVEITIHLVGASLQAEGPDKNLAMLLEAEKIAQMLENPVQVARIQLLIGRAHYYGGRLKEAVDYYQKVLLSSAELEDPELLSLPGAVIGRVLFMQGRFNQSVQILDEAISLLEREKNRHELLFAYVHRSMAQTCLGHYAAGLSGLNRTLEIARSSQDQNAEIMAHAGLAFAQLMAGEYHEGITSAREALAIAEKTGDSFFRYALNGFLAWGKAGLGDARESLPYWAAATEEAKSFAGGRVLLGEWFAAIEADALIDAVNPTAGLRRAHEALHLSETTESLIGEALAERAIGRALILIKEHPRDALAHLRRSVKICQEIDAKFELVRSLLAQGSAHLTCLELTEAVTALTAAKTMAGECQLEKEELRAQDLLAKITDNLK